MPWWGWLIVGLFAGAFTGFLVAATLCAAGEASRAEDRARAARYAPKPDGDGSA